MPIQQVRQQPAPALLVAHLIGALRNGGQQGVHQLVYGLLCLAVLPLVRLGHGGSWYIAEFPNKLPALTFEPVPQAQRRYTVVSVVALDLQQKLVSSALLPQLKPRLEFDDARARIA